MSIDKFTADESSAMGARIAIMDKAVLAPLIKRTEVRDDVIQILLPVEQAARLLDIKQPRWNTPDGAAALKNFIPEVNTRAIGHEFSATINTGKVKTAEITFQIVGLLPPTVKWSDSAVSTIKNHTAEFHPIEKIVKDLQAINTSFETFSFVAINPDSAAFVKSSYQPDTFDNFFYTTIVASFADVQSAVAFQAEAQATCIKFGQAECQPIQSSELASNQIAIKNSLDATNVNITAFTIILTIVAAVIMAGTISRVVSDEQQALALYRAVGATTRNIFQVFSVYILMLCLLIVVASTAISLILSGIITMTNTDTITANVAAMHNVPDLAPIIFIGFDPRIFLAYLAVFAVGIFCLLLVIKKLANKNIVKDLRK